MLILIVSFSIALLDQATKHLVRSSFGLGESVEVIPGWLSLTYIQNTGAAWGMFPGLNAWLLLLSAVMLVVLILFRKSLITDMTVHRVAFGLMTAGIVGNLLDRVRYGYIVDFVDVFWRSHHFPAFNVADAAICLGVGLYAISQLVAASPPEADARS